MSLSFCKFYFQNFRAEIVNELIFKPLSAVLFYQFIKAFTVQEIKALIVTGSYFCVIILRSGLARVDAYD